MFKNLTLILFFSAKIPPGTTDSMLTDSESVDELFVATFDSIRDSVADAIRNICNLIGELTSLSTEFYLPWWF